MDVLNIHLLSYLSDPTDPMTSLRRHIVITPTPGLGTPVLQGSNVLLIRLRFMHSLLETDKKKCNFHQSGVILWIKPWNSISS